VEAHVAESRIPFFAGIRGNGFKIEPFGRRMGNKRAGGSIVQGLAIAIAGDPSAGNIVFQFCHKSRQIGDGAKLGEMQTHVSMNLPDLSHQLKLPQMVHKMLVQQLYVHGVVEVAEKHIGSGERGVVFKHHKKIVQLFL